LTLAQLFNTIGLVAGIIGAGILAWGLFVNKDEAARLRGNAGLSYFMDKPPSREQMEHQYAVQDLLRQSRRAKWGFALLVIAFLFQLVGTWVY
jgi:hypothetical protein